MRFIGGGDIKLLTALVLYTGKPVTFDFLVYVTILGGIGTLLLLVLRSMLSYIILRLGHSQESLPRVLRTGERYVPYGVAIAIAFLGLLWSGKLPGLVL